MVNVIDAYNRSFSQRLALNRAILDNQYWVLPVDNKGHENFVPVGRAQKTGDHCGSWSHVSVCKNVEGHEGIHVDGLDCTGKVVVRHNHLWCNKSSCPVCFIRGYSSREARSIGGRFVEAEKRGLGKPEHISVSVPVADRDLPEPVLRLKCREALIDRGVVGGCMIFHGYRIDRNRRALVWSPHYHSLAIVGNGGFERCRGCVHGRDDCRGCDGFKGREVRGYARDGYLVKVHDARKTVVGTAHYQLNHATVRLGIRRFHIVTWFGSVSYCKFKSEPLKVESVCPACSEEMVKSFHVGKRHIVKDIGSRDYVPLFVDDEFDNNGEANYVDAVGGKFG